MVTVEKTATVVQLEELEPTFQPPDLSPDQDREVEVRVEKEVRQEEQQAMDQEEVMEEELLDLHTADELRTRRLGRWRRRSRV